MSGITLAIAQKKVADYLEAEDCVLQGQAYSIGDRSLTRADLKEIREGLMKWEKICDRLANGSRGARVQRVVPRDL